jgi:hypothetical protein
MTYLPSGWLGDRDPSFSRTLRGGPESLFTRLCSQENAGVVGAEATSERKWLQAVVNTD